MAQESLRQSRSYFSSNSIRKRYAQHIQSEPVEHDPLVEVARETVEIMRRNGKSDDEIRSALELKFHFSEELIATLLSK